MDEVKKICLVIPSLHPGGMERVMSKLANQFINYENTEIHLVLYGKKRDVFYQIPEAIIIHKPHFYLIIIAESLVQLKQYFFS